MIANREWNCVIKAGLSRSGIRLFEGQRQTERAALVGPRVANWQSPHERIGNAYESYAEVPKED